MLTFRIFGGLEAIRDGVRLELGTPKQRALLGILLLDAGHVVPSDRLVDALWGDRAPAQASTSLQVYVSNLRRVLEPERDRRQPARVLVTQGGGYRLDVERDQLDLTRFEHLAQSGSELLRAGDLQGAVAALGEALGLADAPPLPELPPELTYEVTARWEGRRAAALEDLFAARLQLGEHAALTGQIEAAIAEHPLHEGLRAQLALALYRSGRQVEALRSLDAARRQLAEEAGVDPGPALRKLEADILAQDPRLDWAPAPAGAGAPPPDPQPATAPAAPPAASPAPGAAPAAGDPPPAPPAAAVPVGPRFVGREAELEALVAAARSAAAGRGGAAVVSGEPGIGKTRLVQELAARCTELGMAVGWGRCPESGAAPPFWPANQMAEQLRAAGIIDPRYTGPFDTEPGDEDGAGAARFALQLNVTRALSTSTRPVLLVIDDLQWADAATLRLLELLAGDLAALAALVVVTTRPVRPDADPALLDCLGELARQPGSVHLDLGGLSEQVVAQWLSGPDGAAVAPSTARLLHDRTGGNPFYLRELVELLSTEGRLGDPRAGMRTVPTAVQGVIRRRVARLPADSQRLLSTASVVGRSFDVDVLSIVAGLDANGTLDRLDPACEAGLVVEDDEPGRFRFSHALVAEALEAELAAPRRARMHVEVVRALEATRAADLEPHLPELAHHAFAGIAAGTAEEAYQYSVRAAQAAASRAAPEDAVRHWTRALDALERTRPGDTAARYDALVELGKAHFQADEVAEADDALLAAISAAESLGDPARMATAAALLNHASVWPTRDHGEVSAAVIDALERTLAALPTDDAPERARMLGCLASELIYGGDQQRCIDLAEEAVAMARRIGDPVVLARALNNQFHAYWRPRLLESQHAIAQELVSLADSGVLGDADTAMANLCLSVTARAQALGKVADESLERSLEHARRAGAMSTVVQGTFSRGAMALMQGKLAEAERLCNEAADLYRRGRRFAAERIQLAIAAQVMVERGQAVELAQMLDAGIGEGFDELYVRAVGWAYTEAGRLDDARRIAERTTVEADDDWTWYVSTGLAAWTAAEIADRDRAGEWYEALRPYAGRVIMSGTSAPVLGAADLILARLAALQEDHEQAEEHFRQAVLVNEQAHIPIWTARTLLLYGEWQLAQGRDGWRELVDRAVAIARTTESVVVPERAARLGARQAGSK